MPNGFGNIDEAIEHFIHRWQDAEASERANYQMFLAELSDRLEPLGGESRVDDCCGIVKLIPEYEKQLKNKKSWTDRF